MFVCKCKCGNTKITPKKLVLRNSVTSVVALKVQQNIVNTKYNITKIIKMLLIRLESRISNISQVKKLEELALKEPQIG